MINSINVAYTKIKIKHLETIKPGVVCYQN